MGNGETELKMLKLMLILNVILIVLKFAAKTPACTVSERFTYLRDTFTGKLASRVRPRHNLFWVDSTIDRLRNFAY
jgi:hypothetical protein